MNTEPSTTTPLPASAANCFLRGFLLRLLYGLFGLPILALITPNLYGEKLHILVGVIAFYLFVCIAGGAQDVAAGIKEEFRSRGCSICCSSASR